MTTMKSLFALHHRIQTELVGVLHNKAKIHLDIIFQTVDRTTYLPIEVIHCVGLEIDAVARHILHSFGVVAIQMSIF